MSAPGGLSQSETGLFVPLQRCNVCLLLVVLSSTRVQSNVPEKKTGLQNPLDVQMHLAAVVCWTVQLAFVSTAGICQTLIRHAQRSYSNRHVGNRRRHESQVSRTRVHTYRGKHKRLQTATLKSHIGIKPRQHMLLIRQHMEQALQTSRKTIATTN